MSTRAWSEFSGTESEPEVCDEVCKRGNTTMIRPASLIYVSHANVWLWILFLIVIVIVSMTIEYKFAFVAKIMQRIRR